MDSNTIWGLKGENVVVTLPNDLELLADTVEPAPGAVCTSPIQTYLDLSIFVFQRIGWHLDRTRYADCGT